MYKHIQADHKEEEKQVNFEMKVVGRFKDAMSRQIDEAVRINKQSLKTFNLVTKERKNKIHFFYLLVMKN